jgi:GT2 family glycosyltransferase
MFVSIIIPTHNRCGHVVRAVEALMNQNYLHESYEVIVCCDRCTDGTEQALRCRFGNRIEVIQSSVPGQSAALNKGWRRARGELAIMLDDEMEAAEGFITAHVTAHRANGKSKIAVTGYSPVAFGREATPIIRQLAKSFEDYFQELDRPGHDSTPLDMLGGNFSIPTAVLREVGGFNESYPFQRCDFELAARLLENGYKFRFSREARANDRIAIDANTLIGRATERAQADYRLAREHPWCLPYLQFYRPLHYPAPRRRWRVLWEACGAAARVLSMLRKFSPNNLRLGNLEYLCRYCVGLRREAGNWQEFCRLGKSMQEN